MEEKFEFTRSELKKAFDLWAKQAQDNPEDFDDGNYDNYGSNCADYLIELLEV